MANEALTSAVKGIIALARGGNVDASYDGYTELFGRADFRGSRPEDQRQVLKLMLRGTDSVKHPSESVLAAHRAALAPLTELVSTFSEPGDHEMLGLCHLLLGNADSASAIFRAGLALERERSPQSDLCGSLMKRISLI